jgi:hypothetical protein
MIGGGIGVVRGIPTPSGMGLYIMGKGRLGRAFSFFFWVTLLFCHCGYMVRVSTVVDDGGCIVGLYRCWGVW